MTHKLSFAVCNDVHVHVCVWREREVGENTHVIHFYLVIIVVQFTSSSTNGNHTFSHDDWGNYVTNS